MAQAWEERKYEYELSFIENYLMDYTGTRRKFFSELLQGDIDIDEVVRDLKNYGISDSAIQEFIPSLTSEEIDTIAYGPNYKQNLPVFRYIEPVETLIIVEDNDTDESGYMLNSRIVEWFDKAKLNLFYSIGWSSERFANESLRIKDVRYKFQVNDPVRRGEILSVFCKLIDVTEISFTIEYIIENHKSKSLYSSGYSWSILSSEDLSDMVSAKRCPELFNDLKSIKTSPQYKFY